MLISLKRNVQWPKLWIIYVNFYSQFFDIFSCPQNNHHIRNKLKTINITLNILVIASCQVTLKWSNEQNPTNKSIDYEFFISFASGSNVSGAHISKHTL